MIFKHRLFTALLALLSATVLTDQAAALYDPGVGRFCSRDPIGYADGKNLFILYGGIKSSDPMGTHVFLNPDTAPAGIPWEDDFPEDPTSEAGTYLRPPPAIKCECIECKKCTDRKSAYVDRCTIKLSFKIVINVPLARTIPPPNPIPPGWSEPEWTYGHEQRHVENVINEARRLMKEMDEYTKKTRCKPVEDCETEALLLTLKYYDKLLTYWNDEIAHKHPPFNTGDPYKGFPPIGKMPNATRS